MCSLGMFVKAVASPEWVEVCGVHWLSPRVVAGFVSARVDLLWSALLGEFLQVSLLPAWPWLSHWGRLQHAFLDILRAAAFVLQLQRLPVLPCEDGD